MNPLTRKYEDFVKMKKRRLKSPLFHLILALVVIYERFLKIFQQMTPTIITNTVPTIIIAKKSSTKKTPLGLGSEISLSIANTVELPKVNTNIPSNKVIIFFMLFSPNLHVQSLHPILQTLYIVNL